MSSFQVPVAVCPQTQMQYFDIEAKTWKPLESLAPAADVGHCYCAETVGSKLYVAGFEGDTASTASHYIYCYDIEKNVWEKYPHSCGNIDQLLTVGDYMYAVSSYRYQVPQRYSFAEQEWQSFAKPGITEGYFFYSGATVLHSKVFVLYGKVLSSGYLCSAVLYVFDPVKNLWEGKTSTCQPHYGSSLFLVNGRMYVVGGNVCCKPSNGRPYGNFASVEVYDEENNKWSVVDQKHIPANNLGAVEIEGKVYFIINRFPVDSGIRIPPEELYPVSLEKWKNLSNISTNAALSYVPVKRDSLKKE